jgi:hypothetical protein
MTREEYRLTACLHARRGNELSNARLNPDAVRAIRANVRGETDKEQARRYGVHYNTITRIRHFEAWRHVR